MKKIILISIIVGLLAPVTFFATDIQRVAMPLIAHAQAQEDEIGSEEPAVSQTRPSQQTSGVKEPCSVYNLYCNLINGFEWLLAVVAFVPIFITSYMVHISGLLLNVVVIDTVIDFSAHFNPIKSINDTWEVLRDLANILFIFGLLTIAIATIIGLSSYGYKQLLARLLIVALVINFSLLFTKVVIDTSNIFALQFYQGIAGKSREAGISNTFTRYLGVASLYETGTVLETLKTYASKEGGLGLVFTYSVFVSIFFSITAFVFFFAAIMLIIRAVGFVLLSILSPLAFAAMILPKTQELAELWWKKLWQYAIFAPMLFLLFWVTVKVMPGISGSIGNSGGLLQIFSTELENRSGATSLIMNFLILTILMLASVIIANKLSLDGSKTITGWGMATARRIGKAPLDWSRRRLATLAREVESDTAKERRAWNPMHYIMKAVRPIGKGVMAVPGAGSLVRQGLQATAATYRRDVAARESELEQYSTKELVRRLTATTLPVNRNAIARVIQKRNDFDDLGFDKEGIEKVRMARRAFKNAGISTRLINRLRPDTFTEAEIEMGVLENTVRAMKPEDISKMHEDVFRKASPDMRRAMTDAMVRNFSAKQANAAIRRLDDMGKEYLSLLKERAGSDNLNDIVRYLDTGVESFNKKEPDKRIKVTEKTIKDAESLAVDAERRNAPDAARLRADVDTLRQQRARIMTVVDYVQRAPSQRAWGIKGGSSRGGGGPGAGPGTGSGTPSGSGSLSQAEQDAIDDDTLDEEEGGTT